jgi:beta-glucosidase
MAEHNDLAIFCLGRISGEGDDRTVENDFNLSEKESSLISTLSDIFHAKGKKLIIVLNTGGVIEVSSWKDKADAIVWSGLPGQEGGAQLPI